MLLRTAMTWKGRLELGGSWKPVCIIALEFAFISEDNVEVSVVFRQKNGVVRMNYREKTANRITGDG